MNGILGDLSWQYQKPGGFIYDNVKEKKLELYPAGYTQTFFKKRSDIQDIRACEQVNRQEFYKKLYKQAEIAGRDGELFPFRGYKYDLYLEHDPKNKYDKYAIKIVLVAKDDPNVEYWNDYSIGFIPAKINRVILKNMERINDIQILSVVDVLNDKFYCARIIIAYDGAILREEAELPERILAII
jgi:hypothetical protein